MTSSVRVGGASQEKRTKARKSGEKNSGSVTLVKVSPELGENGVNDQKSPSEGGVRVGDIGDTSIDGGALGGFMGVPDFHSLTNYDASPKGQPM